MSHEIPTMSGNTEEEGFDPVTQMNEDLKIVSAELDDNTDEEKSIDPEMEQNIAEQQERSETLFKRLDKNSETIENLSDEEMAQNPEGLSNLQGKIKGAFDRFVERFSEKGKDPEGARMKVMAGSLGLGVLAAAANILGTPELNDTIASLPEQLQAFLQSPQSAFNTLSLLPLESFNPEWTNINTPEFVEQIRASENPFMELGATEKGARMGSALTNAISGAGIGIVLGTVSKKITETLNTLGAKMKK
jgi:hypothetical protein